MLKFIPDTTENVFKHGTGEVGGRNSPPLTYWGWRMTNHSCSGPLMCLLKMAQKKRSWCRLKYWTLITIHNSSHLNGFLRLPVWSPEEMEVRDGVRIWSGAAEVTIRAWSACRFAFIFLTRITSPGRIHPGEAADMSPLILFWGRDGEAVWGCVLVIRVINVQYITSKWSDFDPQENRWLKTKTFSDKTGGC